MEFIAALIFGISLPISLIVVFIIKTLRKIKTSRVLKKPFRNAGIPITKAEIEQYRREVLDITKRYGLTDFQDTLQQRKEMASIRDEKDRITYLVQHSPDMVHEVGKALRAIEKHYKKGLKSVKSDQAKVTLQKAAQNEIRNLVNVLDGSLDDMPPFDLDS